MQNQDLELNIEDILSEFKSPAPETPQAPRAGSSFMGAEEETALSRREEDSPVSLPLRGGGPSAHTGVGEVVSPQKMTDPTTAWEPPEEKITHYADKYRQPDRDRNVKERKPAARGASSEKSEKEIISKAKIRKEKTEKEKREKIEKIEKREKIEKKEKTVRRGSPLLSFTGAVFTLLCLMFIAIFVHPAAGSSSTLVKKETTTVDLTSSIDSLTQLTASQIRAAEATPEPSPEPTPEPTPVKAHYTITESDLVAPVPDAAAYGSVMPDSAAEIDNVIARARDFGLLSPSETTVFRSDADFRSDTAIRYYLDETILVICWKELIDGNTCSCAEVKVADASQLRRKFADDTFGSSNSYYATDLAKSVNAVAAVNADYYLFRDFGIVVYNRELYRFNEGTYSGNYKKYNCVDTCFITETGDFLYFRKGQETTEEELRQYIADNGIVFSIAFGPILVENGEAVYVDSYPVGEIDKGYSRAGFGQVDTLHYFYMNLNHSNEKQARWNINTFAQHFAEKGVMTAYAFDGGQTGELVFQGEPYNYIDFGAERLVSDILYFATALPGEGAVS